MIPFPWRFAEPDVHGLSKVDMLLPFFGTVISWLSLKVERLLSVIGCVAVTFEPKEPDLPSLAVAQPRCRA